MKQLFFGFCALLFGGVTLMACGNLAESDGRLDKQRKSITGNIGAVVASESNAAGLGRYREVMYVLVQKADGSWGACTGTVIAPYAVLTAAHCRGSLSVNRENRFVRWNGVSFRVSNDFTNPYAANLKFYRRLNLTLPHGRQNGDNEERPFAPQWYLDERGVQRTEPAILPHMHDSHIFYVPGLTPSFLSQNGIKIAKVDAYAFTRALFLGTSWQIRGVGVGSTGGRQRRSVAYRLRSPNHRSGFLTIDENAVGFGNPDGGDSGGPIFGQLMFGGIPLLNATNVLLGTHQNNDDLVPLAYHPNAPAANNPNTMESIRRNHLWTMARAQDVDNDGITSVCDPNIAVANAAHHNRCPAPVGSPQGAATQGYPQGLLMCPKHHYVAGMRGRYSYNGVIHMSLLCRARSCLENSGLCLSEFWTDTYGGDPSPDGNQFIIRERTGRCGQGRSVNRMRFRVLSSEIFHIKAYCSDFPLGTNSADLTSLGREGGSVHTRQCPKGEHVVGVVAHNQTYKRISGIQIICSGAVAPQGL